MSTSQQPSTATTDRRAEVRDAFRRERGFWAEPFEHILQADPEFMAAYTDFSSTPWRNGALEPKVREFIYIAVDAAVQHMHVGGTMSHMRTALACGATPEELASLLQITSLVGLQSMQLGAAALRRALSPQDSPGADRPAQEVTDPIESAADDRDWLARFAELDESGAAAARAWIEQVHGSSPLQPKVIELIGIAVNASTCHLNEAATATHVRRALAAGASPAEIIEVVELIAVLGIQSAAMAFPILHDLRAEHDGAPSDER